jgi:hypothetical protein
MWQGKIKLDLTEIGIEGELDSAGSGQDPVGGFCENGDETPVSIKKGYFFDNLSVNQLFK